MHDVITAEAGPAAPPREQYSLTYEQPPPQCPIKGATGVRANTEINFHMYPSAVMRAGTLINRQSLSSFRQISGSNGAIWWEYHQIY